MVIAAVCVALVSVPLVALLAVRLTSNQFVRETEQSLIQQGAIYAEIYAQTFSALDGPLVGAILSDAQKEHWGAKFHPARAHLNVRQDTVGPPRPDGTAVTAPLDPRYSAVTPRLIRLAKRSQRTTLAGVVFLDHAGRDLNSEGAPSLAALDEVKSALAGDIGAALRWRSDDFESHRFSSLSRDTGYRVFLTYPVLVDERVVGVVYLSRTPLNLGKFLFQERYALMIMLVSTLVGAGLIGLLLQRLISRPIHALRDRSRAIAAQRNPNVRAIGHYGLRELADLGESVSSMAATLSRRSQEISTYTDHVTHELKSPVTAVIGAAELLKSDGITPDNKLKLLDNIEVESRRMNSLLGKLREMTRVRTSHEGGSGRLADMIPDIDGLSITSTAPLDTVLPISPEHGQMILQQMAQNSLAHGAGRLTLGYAQGVLTLSDDGSGVLDSNLDRLTEPFFTTRREHGGTGMGLSIVAAVLEGYEASIRCVPSETGACFEVHFGKTV